MDTTSPDIKISVTNISLPQAGFIGAFHSTSSGLFSGKAIIVMSGSDGDFNNAKAVARHFCLHGVNTLALAYWNQPGLPKQLAEVPVETVEKAVHWLKENGTQKIGIYGLSKGAELALLASSLLPDISCCVAVSPSCCVWAGFKGKGRYAAKSSWSYRGTPLPYLPVRMQIGAVLRQSFQQRQPSFAVLYGQALQQTNEINFIKAENIKGPVLLISALQDSIWPSAKMGEHIMNRMQNHNFKHSCAHLTYEKASHIMIPLRSKLCRFFAVERKYPRECDASRKEAFEKTLAFLQQW